MSENEEKMLKTFEKIIPYLSEKQRDYLLGYAEAILDIKVGLEKEIKTA